MNMLRMGLKGAAIAALGVGTLASPASADDCGVWGWGGGFSFSYNTHFNDGCFSVGYSTPLIYAGGPRYYGGYRGYGGYGGYSRYYDDCGPRYYERPSYRHYYRPSTPRYYYRSYPRHYRRYDDCGSYYWSGGYALEGYYVSSAGEDNVLRYRDDRYAGDPALSGDAGFRVASAKTDLERAEELDPQWAGGAIAMLRKGQADEAIVALEEAAYPRASGLQAASFVPSAPSAPGLEQPADTGSLIVSDIGGVAPAPAEAGGTPGNPEAVRMLGLAMIADGQIDEGAAKITEAYALDTSLASVPIDERLFPSSARLDVRDLIRRVSIRANRTNAPEAWFALGVLMQAEDRDSVALDMVLKASAQGLDQSVVSPMADALRRVVYARR